MRMCIAYCGGCNAGYDRVAFVRGVLAAAAAAGVQPIIVDADQPCDLALVMAGCQSLCVADRDDLGQLARERHVVGPKMLDAVSMSFDEIHDRLRDALIRISQSV